MDLKLEKNNILEINNKFNNIYNNKYKTIYESITKRNQKN